jgi:hypothetical protein
VFSKHELLETDIKHICKLCVVDEDTLVLVMSSQSTQMYTVCCLRIEYFNVLTLHWRMSRPGFVLRVSELFHARHVVVSVHSGVRFLVL